MLKSMTTYCRLQEEQQGWAVALELRSVNSRFFDLHLRAPRWLNPLEERIRNLVRRHLMRGRVELSIRMEGEVAPAPVVRCDQTLARAYMRAMEELAQALGISKAVSLRDLLDTAKEIISVEEQEQDSDEVWHVLEPALQRCLQEAEAMARREGGNLQADLEGRLSAIEKRIEAIEGATAHRQEQLLERLRQRISQIIVEVPFDEDRLLQEVALQVDRLDITEELVRARSHIGQFRSLLTKEGPVGRTMDFLLQELFREVNTIASKSQDSEISHLVVDIKAELEKMREQVQNIV